LEEYYIQTANMANFLLKKCKYFNDEIVSHANWLIGIQASGQKLPFKAIRVQYISQIVDNCYRLCNFPQHMK
jgi:hypothetical protein